MLEATKSRGDGTDAPVQLLAQFMVAEPSRYVLRVAFDGMKYQLHEDLTGPIYSASALEGLGEQVIKGQPVQKSAAATESAQFFDGVPPAAKDLQQQLHGQVCDLSHA